MTLHQINELTKIAYDQTAEKYHAHFKDEMAQKAYDRQMLDGFSAMLPTHAAICDAGCGPTGHIGQYLAAKGHKVTGIDISPRCIDIATAYSPQIDFRVMDMAATDFADASYDAVIAFYSIIYTPRQHVPLLFAEFSRILKVGGKLLVVVKKGADEGLIDNEWYEGNPVYFTHFMEDELSAYFADAGFDIDSLAVRQPYDFELAVDRIYGVGTKML